MEDYYRSKSYGNGNNMQIESYYGPPRPPPHTSYDIRCYSASYAQTQVANNTNFGTTDSKFKKGKDGAASGSGSFSKSWSFADPEFQRKKRVASYKRYGVEGKVKGSVRKSFRWLKDRYTLVVYGWW